MTLPFKLPQHPSAGVPATTYVYRDASGQPVLLANRYETGGGKKFFLPYDMIRQNWKAPETRTLYNLDSIMKADPSCPVLVVEGEKCADALTGLGLLATTCFGGSNGVSKTDLSPLQDRTVYIWPDHDEPGQKYAKSVSDTLLKYAECDPFLLPVSEETARNVLKIGVTGPLPKGWDAADAVASGCDAAQIRQMMSIGAQLRVNQVGKTQQDCPLLDQIDLWHTPDREAFASIKRGNHVENMSLESSDFRNLLSFAHYSAEGKMMSQSALEDRRRAMVGQALFEGEEHRVFTRLAAQNGRLHLDLGGKDWTSVTVSRDGWEICKHAPVKFQRSKAMKALPVPDANNADINLLRPFLNVSSDTDFRMLVAWLLGCLHPKGPYPILILTGEQGCAKSTTSKVLRSLIDPADPMARSAPTSEQDLVIAARHNHVLAFDNLSYIKAGMADALCRIATGGGFGTRKLHTNAEEVLFTATRPCLLNGIPDLASRPDLADRSIIVTLPVIPPNERKFEGEFWREFEAVAPRILAALLNAASAAIANLRTTDLKDRPRMADFAKWVTAAEPAFEWENGAFMAAYNANRRAVRQAAIDSNPVAEAIISYAALKKDWKGTASDLLSELRFTFPLLVDDIQGFPRTPNKLSEAIKRIQPLLREKGITLTQSREGKAGVRILSIKLEE